MMMITAVRMTAHVVVCLLLFAHVVTHLAAKPQNDPHSTVFVIVLRQGLRCHSRRSQAIGRGFRLSHKNIFENVLTQGYEMIHATNQNVNINALGWPL
mmetsp:Transcript_93414/g.164578  ORF Transcript_93414/g.164578 Transcript_93414/m.164578 type:complete len:98 (-) Transcript_93414:1563-1856(-)